MFIEFDQTTMANMTAALEAVCKQLPAERDCPGSRKRIADAIFGCAKAGRRTLERCVRLADEANERLLAPLDLEERRTLMSLLARVHEG